MKIVQTTLKLLKTSKLIQEQYLVKESIKPNPVSWLNKQQPPRRNQHRRGHYKQNKTQSQAGYV